jgi:hypothetical protein
MRLFELVDSDQQVLDLIEPILLRAKSEGATSVDMKQLVNDLDSSDNITPELLLDILSRKRNELKHLVNNATMDRIELNTGVTKAMTSKFDQDTQKMKSTALKQAMDQLK